MEVKFSDDIRLELKVTNRESLYGSWSSIEAKVYVLDDAAEFFWTREYRSDEELELLDIFEKAEALLVGDEKLGEQIECSLTAIACASDKVGCLIREGAIWDCVRLIEGLLIGRHGSPDAALHKLRQVREAFEKR
ncbi:hypothetical protein GG496_000980 [Candidatus Fervidibacteria bacterium JGI MDM2 JNZ-1-D12]